MGSDRDGLGTLRDGVGPRWFRYPRPISLGGTVTPFAPFLTEIGGMAPQKRADQDRAQWGGSDLPPNRGGCSGPGRTTGVIQVLASVAEQSQVTPARPPRPVLCRSAAGPWVHPEDSKRGVRSVAGRQGQTPLTGSSTKSFNCPDLCVPGGFRTPTHYEIKNSMGHAKTPSVGTFRMPGGTDVSFPPGVGRIRGCVQQ